ncbi:MAG: 3-methyl-2-oxobutanoate dehydrogenase (ferredoxin), alpha subunit [Acidobacteria bacterium]|nr:3-methyl-2-oxobutanoate dehydrogenase (ferredoxin), alpha subunit [Acidobacteriota bacterium]
MKGSEAIGEAAVQAGCRLFFGYPITPQNEIPEYMSLRLPQVGGCFVQAESEVAASNMLYGASGTGHRVMTSSSSPGISLMSEAASYLAGAELPVVIVNIVRAGPGLGGILPSQGDYFQATRGMGHGDFRLLVLAPWSVQEAADLVQDAFDLADFYRNPVMVLGDGLIGQMMEPVEFSSDRKPIKDLPPKTWAATGCPGDRPTNIINSLFLDPEALERHNWKLKAKYDAMTRDETRSASYGVDDDYDVLIVAYGTVARVCSTAIEELRERGIKVAMVRPVTLFPYPYQAVREAALRASSVLVVELSTGQMIEDVRLALEGARPIHFLSRVGGMLVTPDDVMARVERVLAGGAGEVSHG